MARCCGGATCACKVEAGRHVTITGTGSAQDPFVIAADTHLETEDTNQFQLVLNGNGTLASPWVLQVLYNASAGLSGLPDVDAETPSNGEVLGWNNTSGQWEPQAATTAAPGAITAGNGLDGDGSGGDPLIAIGNTARYITVTASGIGLTDSGLNQLIRRFSDTTARDAASPAVIEGTISILDSDPYRLERYDGVEWVPITGGMGRDIDGQLLATSGDYAGGPTTTYTRMISVNTDGTGLFTVIPAGNLTDYSGVISCKVQPTGTGTPWQAMVTTGGGAVTGRAIRMSDGAAHAGATITAVVEAILY
jgi:hypothetical protein